MNPRIRRSIQAMCGYTPGEQPRDRRLIKLNTNENPYPPSPRVAEALAALEPADLRLYPDPLCGALRDHIARMHGVRPEQVFVANGSDEALALCTRVFVEDDGTIGCFDPSYSLYPVLAEIRNVPVRPVELGPRFEWRMPDGYRASLFFMTSPNAPTGTGYPKEQIRAFCEGFPGVVLIDEAYVDFADGHCMDLAASLPNVLVLRTLSKSFSLAGLRVGYVAGDAELVGALLKAKDSYNLDVVAQRLALAALSDLDYMRGSAARIRSTRGRLTEALRAMGFDVLPSQTNFVFARPPRPAAAEFFAGLRERGILVRYFPGPRTGDYLRITIGTDPDIDRLIEVARELVR